MFCLLYANTRTHTQQRYREIDTIFQLNLDLFCFVCCESLTVLLYFIFFFTLFSHIFFFILFPKPLDALSFANANTTNVCKICDVNNHFVKTNVYTSHTTQHTITSSYII